MNSENGTNMTDVKFFGRRTVARMSSKTKLVLLGFIAVVAFLTIAKPTTQHAATGDGPSTLFGKAAIAHLKRTGNFDSLARVVRSTTDLPFSDIGDFKAKKDIGSIEAATAFGGSLKLQATDGITGDQFGESVAISGNTAVIGANAIGGAIGGSGSAYVYVRIGGAWTLQQKLTASDGAPDDAFGTSVAVSGDTVVVGSFADTVGTNAQQGSAYVFVRTGTTWTQQQKLVAGDGASFDIFGRRVSISGETIAVTAPNKDITTNVDQGATYIYLRTGTVWTQQQRLTAADGVSTDYLGDSLVLAGDTVVVGAPDESTGANTQQGSAYVFVRSGTTWTQQQKLTASDGTIFSNFGTSLAIAGETVVVGTLQDVGANFQQGSVYVFVRSGSTWTQQQKLLASDGSGSDSFGYRVAIFGDMLIATAVADTMGTNMRQGSAYVFGRVGTTWSEQQKLTASDGAAEDNFGSGVAMTLDTAIIGSVSDTIGTNLAQGSAYIFAPSVTVSGRVTTPAGLGLRNAIVAMTDSLGVRRTAVTSSFGLYSFDNVRVGENYVVSVSSRRFRFAPASLLINDNVVNLDFIGLE